MRPLSTEDRGPNLRYFHIYKLAGFGRTRVTKIV